MKFNSRSDFVNMDIARYNLKWFSIITTNNKKERDYIKSFRKNLSKSGPVVMLVEREDSVLVVNFYLFPDEDEHNRFIKESDYSDYEKDF